MATLPQLIEEDIQLLDEEMRELLEKSDATTALIIDKGGFLICSQGDDRRFDLTTIAALASGAFMANETIANLVHEPTFNSVYQQGEKVSMFVMTIDEHCLLSVIFKAQVSVGVVKYFAAPGLRPDRPPARHRSGTRARRRVGFVGAEPRRCERHVQKEVGA